MKKDINPSGKSNFEGRARRISEGEIRYYYNREERLKKLRREYASSTPRFFRTKRSRILLILFIDIIIIAIVGYIINKPTNLYLTKRVDNLQLELNVSGIKGKKIIVGFSLKNLGSHTYQFDGSEKVVLKILRKDGSVIIREKMFSPGTKLQSGESTSLIFLFSRDELPPSGELLIYYKNYAIPVFTRTLRF